MKSITSSIKIFPILTTAVSRWLDCRVKQLETKYGLRGELKEVSIKNKLYQKLLSSRHPDDERKYKKYLKYSKQSQRLHKPSIIKKNLICV